MRLRITLITTLALFININAFAKETLIFAIDVIRHGDRTPLIEIPKANYRWKEGLGQLTQEGTEQMLDLGQTFIKRYIKKYQLLSTHYKDGTLLVFSTYHKRSINSAQAILLGMYPQGSEATLPNSHQPIPIHIRSRNKDTKKNTYKKFLDESSTTQSANKIDNDLKDKFKKWSKATGLTITSLKQVKKLAGALYIYNLHNIPLPPDLSTKDIKQILEIGDEQRTSRFQDIKLSKFLSRSLLIDIVAYLQKATRQQTPLKYVLYSDHDSTIASLMTLLGKPLKKSPPYAADLNFLLFKNTQGNYLVKITYNGKPVIPSGCTKKTCPLEQLAKLVNTTE